MSRNVQKTHRHCDKFFFRDLQSPVAPPTDHLQTRSQRIVTSLDQTFQTVYYVTTFDKLEKSLFLHCAKK